MKHVRTYLSDIEITSALRCQQVGGFCVPDQLTLSGLRDQPYRNQCYSAYTYVHSGELSQPVVGGGNDIDYKQIVWCRPALLSKFNAWNSENILLGLG